MTEIVVLDSSHTEFVTSALARLGIVDQRYFATNDEIEAAAHVTLDTKVLTVDFVTRTGNSRIGFLRKARQLGVMGLAIVTDTPFNRIQLEDLEGDGIRVFLKDQLTPLGNQNKEFRDFLSSNGVV
jgi:hypothetical protein